MNAYIDLSFIVFLFNYILSFIYSMIIFDNVKYNRKFIFFTIVFVIISGIINLFFIPYFLVFSIFLYGLFISLFDLRYIKPIYLSLCIYYINCSLLLLIGGCFLYEGMLLISIPYISLFILIEPIYMIIIHLIFNFITNIIKYKKYVFKCLITIEENNYYGKGYYDTGNALLYEEKPVIFIKKQIDSINGKVIKIHGINDIEFTYLAYSGTIKIKNKIKKVYVVYVDNNLNFFNCDFLLNKYLMWGRWNDFKVKTFIKKNII